MDINRYGHYTATINGNNRNNEHDNKQITIMKMFS